MEGVVYIPQSHAHNYSTGIPENLQPNQIPPPMMIPSTSEGMLSQNKQKQKGLVNNKKSKRTLKNKPQTEPEHILKQLQEKNNCFNQYKFGINGILKNDVVELLKQKWYQLVIDESILDAGKSSQLQKVICDFRDCFWQIDQSNKKLDYLLRQLRDKIKPEYVVKFILQKQFFKSFSSTQILQSQSQQQISEQKMQNQQDQAVDEKQQEQYQPLIKIGKIKQNNKMQDVSQSYPYESDSITKKNYYKSHHNQNYQNKRQSNQIDFDLEL